MNRNENTPNWAFDDDEVETMLDDYRVTLDYSGGYGSSLRLDLIQFLVGFARQAKFQIS